MTKGVYAMFSVFFFPIFFTKAFVVGTHLNCSLSMQFKWVPTTYAFIKSRQKVH